MYRERDIYTQHLSILLKPSFPMGDIQRLRGLAAKGTCTRHASPRNAKNAECHVTCVTCQTKSH